MLSRDDILKILNAKQAEMRDRYSVVRIGLFGSYLHGKIKKNSDIDILVEFEKPTFDHYMDLKFYLEALLNNSVDLAISDTLKPRLKPSILKEVLFA